jgi:Arc/MetJ-type ribon-helix-helix transcriptional regulator
MGKSNRGKLRLLEQKIETLRAALIDGELSGPSAPFDIEQFLSEKLTLPRRIIWR